MEGHFTETLDFGFNFEPRNSVGHRRRCNDGAIQTEPFFPLSFLSFSASSQGEKGHVQKRWSGRGLLSPIRSRSWHKREASSSFLFLFRLTWRKRFGGLRRKGTTTISSLDLGFLMFSDFGD
ncbi:hypothetical protein V8G54_035324 [Vigna mungo]|uniref:Uncharacterized protein n=1 Tax=Vigna mungo TaxID=3915 RepID=A0AAQ3MF95_VIGMU